MKAREKGVIIFPKKLRKESCVGGDEVIMELRAGELVLRALKPLVVDVDTKIVEELLRKEGTGRFTHEFLE